MNLPEMVIWPQQVVENNENVAEVISLILLMMIFLRLSYILFPSKYKNKEKLLTKEKLQQRTTLLLSQVSHQLTVIQNLLKDYPLIAEKLQKSVERTTEEITKSLDFHLQGEDSLAYTHAEMAWEVVLAYEDKVRQEIEKSNSTS